MSTYRPISISLFWSLYYALTHYTCVFMFSLLKLTLTRLLLRSTMSKEDRMADLLMLLPNTAKLNWVETGFSPGRHKQKGRQQAYNTRNTHTLNQDVKHLYRDITPKIYQYQLLNPTTTDTSTRHHHQIM